jgi:hypothetical protein
MESYHIQRKTILPAPHDWDTTWRFDDLDQTLDICYSWIENFHKTYPEIEKPERSIRILKVVDGIGTDSFYFV